MSTQRIQIISYLLGESPISNGLNFNWSGKTRNGKSISIYYEVNKPENQLDWVRFYDPLNSLGLPMDSNNVGKMKIMALPIYFTRYGI